MRVKFNNLIPSNPSAFATAFIRVLSSGIYIGGEEVEAFEREWADYCQAKYCVSVSSGQAALEILLRAHNVGYGDEVIVPSWTAVPTWKAVLRVGAIPRGVDVDYDTMLLQPRDYTSPFVKAIIPVHLYGYRASVDYDIPVINDACQAHSLKNLGTGAWSFYPTKNLGAFGDGGAITTNNDMLAQKCRELRDSNRLDPMQAAFLRVKLEGLDLDNRLRAYNSTLYDHNIGLLKEIKMPDFDGLYHQYIVRISDRNQLRQYLFSKGIETLIHYPIPPHRLLGIKGDFPVADRLADEVLSLPITCSQSEVEYICECINEFYKGE